MKKEKSKQQTAHKHQQTANKKTKKGKAPNRKKSEQQTVNSKQ